MKESKFVAFTLAGIVAIFAAIMAVVCLERVDVGYVGVVCTPSGVEEQAVSQGWHFMNPIKSVKPFPISQQQIVFSNNPSDYDSDSHPDWHIDAPANGGMVKINMTVNYSFMPDRVVELYKKFNGMDGETIVENRVQNSIVAYTKEVTPRFTVMDIYSGKRAEVNEAITNYLNEKLTSEYGINVSGALIIDAQLDEELQQKVRAKEQAKQDAEIAALNKETALAQAETDKTKAEAAAEVKLIDARANAEANKTIAASITPELIQMKEAEARLKHGWVTVQGAATVVTEK